jgi:excisionase family DNA binding protein
MPRPEEPLASLEEVAQFLGVPMGTLYRWRSTGQGPPGYRVGRHVRYRWSDVSTWLESRRDQESVDPTPLRRRAIR